MGEITAMFVGMGLGWLLFKPDNKKYPMQQEITDLCRTEADLRAQRQVCVEKLRCNEDAHEMAETCRYLDAVLEHRYKLIDAGWLPPEHKSASLGDS